MLRFKSISYRNFLSAGNNPTIIPLDINRSTLIVGENGAGKSTMLDALCFVLFGRAFRKINKPQLVNSVNGKGLRVEVEFNIGQNEYKIIRGIKPARFEIYENERLLNQDAANKDYQNYLERNILKLNYRSFTQIVILGSSIFVPFMKLRAHERREVIEDLLDIRIFTAMNLLLKTHVQNNTINLSELNNEIKLNEEKLIVHKKYLAEIEADNEKKIEAINAEAEEIANKIETYTDELQKIINAVNLAKEDIVDADSNKTNLTQLNEAQIKIETKIRTAENQADFYRKNTNCPTCDQQLREDHCIGKIDELEDKIDELKNGLRSLYKVKSRLSTRYDEIKELMIIIDDYNIEITRKNSDIEALKMYHDKLLRNIEEVKSSSKASESNVITDLNQHLKKLEENKESEIIKKEMLSIVSEMLKDSGIKTQIIKQYVPVINKLINKYLASLDFFVNFEINDNFEETIKSRHRDDFSYDSFSEGEKMRIDLALLFTWRAIAKMKNSINTNLLILDEVFDASLDIGGCDEFLKLINELDDNTNVFVISHKGDALQDKFEASMKFEKHKNFSRMIA